LAIAQGPSQGKSPWFGDMCWAVAARKESVPWKEIISSADLRKSFMEKNTPSFLSATVRHHSSNQPMSLCAFGNISDCWGTAKWAVLHSTQGKHCFSRMTHRRSMDKVEAKPKLPAFPRNTVALRRLMLQIFQETVANLRPSVCCCPLVRRHQPASTHRLVGRRAETHQCGPTGLSSPACGHRPHALLLPPFPSGSVFATNGSHIQQLFEVTQQICLDTNRTCNIFPLVHHQRSWPGRPTLPGVALGIPHCGELGPALLGLPWNVQLGDSPAVRTTTTSRCQSRLLCRPA